MIEVDSGQKALLLATRDPDSNLLEAEFDAEFQDFDYTDPQVFISEAEDIAKELIIKFFGDKQMYCGGPIPETILLSPRYINMVLNAKSENAVTIVYAAWELHNKLHNKGPLVVKVGGVSDDVRWVIAFLNHCADRKVPPCFVGGIMLIYLEQCEGKPIPEQLDAAVNFDTR